MKWCQRKNVQKFSTTMLKCHFLEKGGGDKWHQNTSVQEFSTNLSHSTDSHSQTLFCFGNKHKSCFFCEVYLARDLPFKSLIWRTINHFFIKFGLQSFKVFRSLKLCKLQHSIAEFSLKQIYNNYPKHPRGAFLEFFYILLSVLFEMFRIHRSPRTVMASISH